MKRKKNIIVFTASSELVGDTFLKKSEFWAKLKGGKSLDELTREVSPSQTRPRDPDKHGICGGH